MSQKTLIKKEKQYYARDMVASIMICMAVMAMSISIFAAMIQSNVIKEHTIGYCIVTIHLVSIITGGCLILRTKAERKLYHSLLLGFVYCGVLMGLTALIFDGQYHGITATFSVVISGCIIPVILGNSGKNVRKTGGPRKRRC